MPTPIKFFVGVGDFLKFLLKFKMAGMDDLHNFFWVQKLKNCQKIIRILQSHYPPSRNVQVILLKFKKTPQV